MKLQAYVLDAEIRLLQSQVYLTCRTLDGKTFTAVDDFFPYCLTQTRNEPLLQSVANIIKIEPVMARRLGKQAMAYRIMTTMQNYYAVVKQLKDSNVLLFNHDLGILKQYLLDRGVRWHLLHTFDGEWQRLKYGMPQVFKVQSVAPEEDHLEPSVLFVDIKTAFASPNNAQAIPVESIAYGRSLGDMHYLTWKDREGLHAGDLYSVERIIPVDSESELLRRFSEVWHRTDLFIFLGEEILGLEYLQARAKQYRLYVSAKDKQELCASAVIAMLQGKHRPLDAMNPSLLCLKSGTEGLERLPILLAECVKLTGLSPSMSMTMSFAQILEWLLIQDMARQGEMVPEKSKQEYLLRRKAINLPEEKLYSEVALISLQRFNADTFASQNLSTEIVRCGCCETRTCQKKQGVFSGMLRALQTRLARVAEIAKSQPQPALLARKALLEHLLDNAYDFFVSPLNRWQSKEIDQMVFERNAHLVAKLLLACREEGVGILYNDESHVLVETPDPGIILRALGAESASLSAERFDRLLVLSQEGFDIRKAALLSGDELVLYGFAFANQPPALVAEQLRVLRHALRQEPEALSHAYQEFREQLVKRAVGASALLFRGKPRKWVGEYEKKDAMVRALEMAVDHGFSPTTVFYLISQGSGSVNERVVLPEDSDDYDPWYYLEAHLLPFAKEVCAKASVDVLLDPAEDSALGDFAASPMK